MRGYLLGFALSLAVSLCFACGGTNSRGATKPEPVGLAALSALNILPPDTAFVAGLDVRKLVASHSWKKYSPILMGRPEVKLATDSLWEVCKIDVLRDVSSVVIGLNENSDEREAILIIDGDFDEATLIRCLRAFAERTSETLSVTSRDGITTFTSDRADHPMSFGWATPHTLVVTPSAISGDPTHLAELLADGPSARDNSDLAGVMAHVSTDQMAWFAVLGVGKFAHLFDQGQAQGTRAIWMSLDAVNADAVVLELGLHLASAIAAESMVEVVNKVWANAGRNADGLTVATSGVDTVLRVTLTASQVEHGIDVALQAFSTGGILGPTLNESAAPADVAAIPADAEKSKSGLASKLLRRGTGKDHPALRDKVKVDYTGWTTDGNVFNSSVQRGQPEVFPLRGVIPGWTEGLQLMVVGEKRRFWIPTELAYAGQPGKPAGMLVFDVELLEIIAGPPPLPAPPDVGAAPSDATRERDGLAWKTTLKGTGTSKPSAEAWVTFHWTAWTPTGFMLESTRQFGRPITIPLEKGALAWKEVLPQMVVGERRLVWAPDKMALTLPGAKPGDLTVFELELVSFVEPPKAPPDVAHPPDGAEKTASGIYSRVLTRGIGTEHPKPDDTVEVHYSGWTADGKMFDSSFTRGRPTRFQVKGTLPGFAEGVQLMVVGEKRRIWIPEELAYKGQAGAPQGTLVFDVELISISQ